MWTGGMLAAQASIQGFAQALFVVAAKWMVVLCGCSHQGWGLSTACKLHPAGHMQAVLHAQLLVGRLRP